VRVRLYRPVHQRRARLLLAIALLLPAGGFLDAAGINPVTVLASGALVVGSLFIAIAALRPVAVVLRTGIIIAGTIGSPSTGLSWKEIVRVEQIDDVVSVETVGNSIYQIQLDRRAARFLSRMIAHALTVR